MILIKNPKFQEFKYKALQKILEHQNVLDIGMSVARSISSFAQSRSPLSFIEGGVAAFNSTVRLIGGDSNDFFSTANGWDVMAYHSNQQALYDILSSGLEGYTSRSIKFAYESDKTFIYDLPSGMIGKTKKALYYRVDQGDKKSIIQYIIKEKIKAGHSKIFSIVEIMVPNGYGGSSVKFDLVTEENIAIPSQTAKDLSAYLKRYMEKGLSRSIILNGPPGTGKSTMAHSVLDELDLKTLKVKYNKNTNSSVLGIISFLVEAFDIEAILLDDFDYFAETTSLLGLLEWIHRHTKLAIAITNSLKSFPPAVIRPGRFDELRTIEHLDEEVMRTVLGDLYGSLSHRVEKWPIAYVNELTLRVRTNVNGNVEEYISELQSRVNAQAKSLEG